MEKIIKKWGNSLVLLFDKEDCIIYDLNEGDHMDVELVKIKKKKVAKE